MAKKRSKTSVKRIKNAPSKKDRKVGCENCGRVIKKQEALFLKKGWSGDRYFCSQSCSYNHTRRKVLFQAIISVLMVCILIAAIYTSVPWEEVFPEERPSHHPSMDRIDTRDMIFKNVRPHDDGYHTEMEIEILITNRGKGPTDKIFIDVFAENTTSRVIDDTFNTSVLKYIDNGTTGHIIPPMKSAKLNGVLVLRPGSHLIYFRIYEDGLRGFIEGQRTIEVTEDQIVMQPWQTKDSSRDIAEDPSGGASMDSAPGFEAVGLFVAVLLVLTVRIWKKNKENRK